MTPSIFEDRIAAPVHALVRWRSWQLPPNFGTVSWQSPLLARRIDTNIKMA
jgi:hypothetical protein